MSHSPKVYLVNPDIIDRYARGESGEEIGKAYGVSQNMIFRALRSAGIDVQYNGRFWTRDEERLVMRLKHEGRTHPEIAALIGRSYRSVHSKIAALRKVKKRPELYMRRRGVDYSEAA